MTDKSNLYFLPHALHCPQCFDELGRISLILHKFIICPRCNVYWFPIAFGKQFAVIKGVSDSST